MEFVDFILVCFSFCHQNKSHLFVSLHHAEAEVGVENATKNIEVVRVTIFANNADAGAVARTNLSKPQPYGIVALTGLVLDAFGCICEERILS